MTRAAPHPCASPGCPRLCPQGQPRCEKHQQAKSAADHARRAPITQLYDRRWKKYRLAFLAAHPLCVLCQAEGRITAASVVDHHPAHKGDYAKFWNASTHRPLCAPHHDRITVGEGDFGR